MRISTTIHTSNNDEMESYLIPGTRRTFVCVALEDTTDSKRSATILFDGNKNDAIDYCQRLLAAVEKAELDPEAN